MCQAIGNLFRLIIVGATCLALAMQIWTALSCELVDLPSDGGGGGTAGIFFKGIDGECEDEQFETEDSLVTGARTTLMVSTCAGFIAGVLVTFEWLFCEICCAGLIEGLAYFLAWTSASSTFMFYGAEFCKADGSAECSYTSASGMLTVAIICYFGCGVLLCFTPQPEPMCKK